jgi:hypothetical protein
LVGENVLKKCNDSDSEMSQMEDELTQEETKDPKKVFK